MRGKEEGRRGEREKMGVGTMSGDEDTREKRNTGERERKARMIGEERERERGELTRRRGV